VALKELIAADPPPEVVIVDYNMPAMNGAQFIGSFSTSVANDKRFARTSLLLMSGLPPSHFQDFMSEFAGLKLGILEKPFSLEILRDKLATINKGPKMATSITNPVPRIVSTPVIGELPSKSGQIAG
jgi:DNA-binding NarL/FixJ family response regulator